MGDIETHEEVDLCQLRDEAFAAMLGQRRSRAGLYDLVDIDSGVLPHETGFFGLALLEQHRAILFDLRKVGQHLLPV